MHRLIAIPPLAMVFVLSACQTPIQAYFADHDYSYPQQIDRRPRVPEVGAAGWRVETCKESPEHASFLAQATRALRDSDARALVGRYCAGAEAFVLTDPFIVIDREPTPEGRPPVDVTYLAMRLECAGKGVPAAGVTLAQATASGSAFRGAHVEQALDGWAIARCKVRTDCWIKWNIALFELVGSQIAFRRFVKHYDPVDYQSSLTALEFVDELQSLSACGRRVVPAGH
jgi:hypothetical protein